MIRKNIKEVPSQEVTMEGVSKTSIQWLFGADDGVPGFFMRRFNMARGGSIPLHGHPWEHEIFILSGEAEVFTDTETITVTAGDALYVPKDELHGYRAIGEDDFEFLCIVPASAAK